MAYANITLNAANNWTASSADPCPCCGPALTCCGCKCCFGNRTTIDFALDLTLPGAKPAGLSDKCWALLQMIKSLSINVPALLNPMNDPPFLCDFVGNPTWQGTVGSITDPCGAEGPTPVILKIQYICSEGPGGAGNYGDWRFQFICGGIVFPRVGGVLPADNVTPTPNCGGASGAVQNKSGVGTDLDINCCGTVVAGFCTGTASITVDHNECCRDVAHGTCIAGNADAAGACTFAMAKEAAPLVPVSRGDWPTWASLLARQASPADKGVGDTVARLIGPKCSAAFKVWYRALFGQPCKCEDRHARWNQKYPYPSE